MRGLQDLELVTYFNFIVTIFFLYNMHDVGVGTYLKPH